MDVSCRTNFIEVVEPATKSAVSPGHRMQATGVVQLVVALTKLYAQISMRENGSGMERSILPANLAKLFGLRMVGSVWRRHDRIARSGKSSLSGLCVCTIGEIC